MNTPFVPGPDDEFRGIIEIDCSEFLPAELKAKLRIGKFLPVAQPCGGDLDDAQKEAGLSPDDLPPAE